ncbi:Uncharacterized protein DAT39_019319 [Clarias magur]|uniref:Uncharacterized protein n=1 Tax=Clarias magur TaxID=1594786 RepID=A0A8J4TJF9_CLAMG|nr:Uncharacterized protein DAT39_019319 [Clarias magur]
MSSHSCARKQRMYRGQNGGRNSSMTRESLQTELMTKASRNSEQDLRRSALHARGNRQDDWNSLSSELQQELAAVQLCNSASAALVNLLGSYLSVVLVLISPPTA